MEKTSLWWRVRVHATNEEQIFDDKTQAKAWAAKVAFTFHDFTMKFDIIEVLEKTEVFTPIRKEE